MSTCVITQPRFFPGLHYLHRMMLADVFVILDTVQISARGEESRTKLRAPHGAQWLTVPVRRSGRDQRLQDTMIDDSQPWRRKAVRTLSHLYSKAPYFTTYFREIAAILEFPYTTLTSFNRASWEPALRPLKVACRFVWASELPVTGWGSRLLLDICKYIGADRYLSGPFGRDYLDVAEFAAEGVIVEFHEYAYPVYRQCFGAFVPWLSYLDMLFNAGLERNRVSAGQRMLASVPSGPASRPFLGSLRSVPPR